jgi:hypothetical protein
MATVAMRVRERTVMGNSSNRSKDDADGTPAVPCYDRRSRTVGREADLRER